MARKEKKSKIKGIPARLQLQMKDSEPGSSPISARVKQPLNSNPNLWNDEKTLVFGKVPATSISDALDLYWQCNVNTENSLEIYSSVNNNVNTVLDSNIPMTPMSLTSSLPFQGRYYGTSSQITDRVGYVNGNHSFQKAIGSAIEISSNNSGNMPPGYVTYNTPYATFSSGGTDRPFSVSFWLRFDRLNQNIFNSTTARIFSTGDFSGTRVDFTVDAVLGSLGSITGIIATCYTNNTNYITKRVNCQEFFDNKWHHFTVTYDASMDSDGISIYIDGIPRPHAISGGGGGGIITGSGIYSGMPNTSSCILIGSGNGFHHDNPVINSATHFISEIGLFNRKLESSEVLKIASSDVPLTKVDFYDFGSRLPVVEPLVKNLEQATTMLTNIDGNIVKGVYDDFLHVKEGTNIKPYTDSNQIAVDGKSSQNQFYALGTDYEGFTEPVWSKTKIEIDFTPSQESQLVGSLGNWMGYYNWSEKKWDGIGGNQNTESFQRSENGYIPLKTGFSPSYHSLYSGLTQEGIGSRGKPFSNFGFPFDPIFHATSSQTFPISSIIDRPFVLEKIVVFISASYQKASGSNIFDNAFNHSFSPIYSKPPVNYDESGRNPDLYPISSSYVVNNLFLLNQRRGTAKNQAITTKGNFDTLTLEGTHNTNNTIRDLITWFEIASFNNDFDNVHSASLYPYRYFRDFTIINSSSNDALFSSWSKNMILSSSVRSPTYSPTEQGNVLGCFMDYTILLGRPYPFGWLGSRSGLSGINASGRDLTNPIEQYSGDVSENTGAGNYNFLVGGPNAKWHKENPYILMPGDQLILGWQVPTADANVFNQTLTSVTASIVTFPAKPAKIILYGSYVSNGQSDNDSYEQVLSTKSVNEALE